MGLVDEVAYKSKQDEGAIKGPRLEVSQLQTHSLQRSRPPSRENHRATINREARKQAAPRTTSRKHHQHVGLRQDSTRDMAQADKSTRHIRHRGQGTRTEALGQRREETSSRGSRGDTFLRSHVAVGARTRRQSPRASRKDVGEELEQRMRDPSGSTAVV